MFHMKHIEISPAVLVSSEEEFAEQFSKVSASVEQVDIDLNHAYDTFPGKSTVSIEELIPVIKLYGFKRIGFHLMIADPIPEINVIAKELKGKDVYVLIHQEIDFRRVLRQAKHLNISFALVIKAETELLPIELYLSFPEIQLMTIETGKQGNPFKPETLERVEWLRNSGYRGKISLDGSVNEDTAELIKRYDVDRVSVGSYISRAQDPIASIEKLSGILNS